MTIKNWPKEDRPREKLLEKGTQALTDAELIAIVFQTGTVGKTALDLSKELLAEFGHLDNLLLHPQDALTKKRGLGPAKFTALLAAIELGKRHRSIRLKPGEVLDHAKVVFQFLSEQLKRHANEVFACLFMDVRLKLLQYEELFHGTINAAQIYPREIVRKALQYNAAKIILAHNHPSGHAIPSTADREVTIRIQQALQLIDVEVVDHVIVGSNEYFSFAEMGLL